ncbi:MAG: UMP kinase [Pseudomonadales bacterium]
MPRFLLKLSGEALGGDSGFGIEPAVMDAICEQIASVHQTGVELAIVLGGGNLFRGQALAADGLERVAGDRMGMLATVMNGIALRDYLIRREIQADLFSAFQIAGMAQPYQRDDVLQSLAAGRVAILTGGTGNPYFTTDTAACLRGIELQVDAILKATNVDGVYNADPKQDPDAIKYNEVTYDEVLAKELGVMDLTAIVLCKEQNMPLVVFAMQQPDNLQRIVRGEAVGTRVVA